MNIQMSVRGLMARLNAPRALPGRQIFALGLVGLAGLVLINAAIVSQRHASEVIETQKMNALAGDLEEQLRTQLGVYQEILHASSTIIAITSGEVSEQTWNGYVRSLQSAGKYPGLGRLSYARYVTESEVDEYLLEFGRTKSEVSLFDGSEHAIVERSESFSKYFPSTIGNDWFTDVARREAALKARDIGEAVLSRKTTCTTLGRTCYVYVLPVYRDGLTYDTVSQRRDELLGFVSVALQSSDILSNTPIEGELLDTMAVNITDESDSDPTRREVYANVGRPASGITVIRTVSLGGRTWQTKITGGEPGPYMLGLELPIIETGTVMLLGTLLLMYYSFIHRNTQMELATQLKLQTARDDLLALTSHQLRTPVAGVKQYLGILVDGMLGKLPKAQFEVLEKAYAANERQIEIIDEILLAAELESGRPWQNVVELDLSQLINTSVKRLRSTSQKDMKVTVKGATRPVYIWQDAATIKAIVENIISNAITYSDPGQSIAVSLESVRDEVVVRVRDNGVGIAHDDLPKLFQRFSRIPNRLSVKAKGSGLGLFIVAKLIQALHGSIEVESVPDGGSTFTVRIPKDARQAM